jgi:hypothetical protein
MIMGVRVLFNDESHAFWKEADGYTIFFTNGYVEIRNSNLEEGKNIAHIKWCGIKSIEISEKPFGRK